MSHALRRVRVGARGGGPCRRRVMLLGTLLLGMVAVGLWALRESMGALNWLRQRQRPDDEARWNMVGAALAGPKPMDTGTESKALHQDSAETRSNLTVFSTAAALSPVLLLAMKSWLDTGAEVLVFLDSMDHIQDASRALLSKQDFGVNKWGSMVLESPRLRLLTSPRLVHGHPLLNETFEFAEQMSTSGWLCYVNGDIFLPDRFKEITSWGQTILESNLRHTEASQTIANASDESSSSIVSSVEADILFVGGRFDCHVHRSANFGDAKDLFDFATKSRLCFYHGHGGKDYFVFRKGLFKRTNVTLPPLLLGVNLWDNWFLNKFWKLAVNLTPVLPVIHLGIVKGSDSSDHNNITRWNAGLIACLPRQYRLIAEGAMFDRKWTMFLCTPKGSTDNVKWHICPALHRRSVKLAPLDRKVYDNAAVDIVPQFENSIKEIKSSALLHQRWSKILCNSTSIINSNSSIMQSVFW